MSFDLEAEASRALLAVDESVSQEGALAIMLDTLRRAYEQGQRDTLRNEAIKQQQGPIL